MNSPVVLGFCSGNVVDDLLHLMSPLKKVISSQRHEGRRESIELSARLFNDDGVEK